MNEAFDRAYPFTYTISAADTWEQKTITVAGDTSGTWLKTNGAGLFICWSMGAGATRLGTAGAWQTPAAALFGATGQTNIIATSGATFYITGVQLEAGSVATTFERRQYGQELALCQRYYETGSTWGGGRYSDGYAILNATFKVTKRTAPTMTFSGWNNTITSSGTTVDGSFFYTPAGTSTVACGAWQSSAEL